MNMPVQKPTYEIMRDLLGTYFKDDEGRLMDEPIDTCIHFLTMFVEWDSILDKIDVEEQVVWSIYYVISGSMTGKPTEEPAMYSSQKRFVKDQIEKHIDKVTADRFDEIIDDLLFGKLKAENEFFRVNEPLIVPILLADINQTAQKALFKKTNAGIYNACEVTKWRFMGIIALIALDEIKAFELSTKILAMRDAEIRGR